MLSVSVCCVQHTAVMDVVITYIHVCACVQGVDIDQVYECIRVWIFCACRYVVWISPRMVATLLLWDIVM